MAIKKKTLLVENTPAKAAAKAAVKKAAIKSAARDVSKGVEATPIEVSDPKDPRLKRYNDSLYLHNKYKNKQQIGSLVYKISLPDKWQKERNKIDSITFKYNSENITKIKQLRDSIFSDTTLSDESKKSLYSKKSLALRRKFNSSPEYADMIARRRYINKNESFKRVSGVLEKYNFNSPDKKFKERGIKPVKWNKNTETYTGGEQENTYKEGRYGSSLVYRNTSPTKGETITTTSYSPEFKKPTQPIVYKKPAAKKESPLIEVSDPKDPRLKSYNDSLSLYNNNLKPDKISKYYSNNIKAAYDFTTNPKKISARYNGKIKPIASIFYNDKKAKAAESKGKSYEYFEPSPETIKKDGLIKKNGKIYDKDGYLIVSNVHSFKKPTQPVKLKKSTESVQNGVLKSDTVQSKPRVKRPGERIVADNRSGNGYPNVDNVYINNKLDSIQNQAGERLKYGTKFTREWQYRKKK